MASFGVEFGKLIQRRREELGWSFAQVAVAVYGDDDQGGESRKRDIQRLEEGHSAKPTFRTLKRFREGFGITQDQIDACRSAQEIELAQFAERLFELIKEAAAQAGLPEDLTVAVTEHYAEGNPDDFDGALRELERALEAEAERRAEGALPGNVSAAVDAVISGVDDLNADGRVDEGVAVIRDELAHAQAAQARIVDKGIAQAVLARDVTLAVEMVLARLALEDGGFNELRALLRDLYERGRDKGLRFDLEVSIALAEVSVARAVDPDQRGVAWNELGITLATLGERESGTARLEEAVAAYRAALEERTGDRVPLDWAMTQMNLGNALRALGQRESGTARLEDAVSAFRAALKEQTRDRVPLDWAKTQNNFGNALATLGERESGTARLVEAVAAYRAALTEWTRDRVPQYWATAQNNLGNALAALGDRERGTVRLVEAVAAYRAALKEQTRDRVPLDWAKMHNNLGMTLATLGERESGTARLDEAGAAYCAALEERTRDRVPLDWAGTQLNLCILERAFFDKSGEAAHLDAAQGYLDAAREVFAAAGAGHYLTKAETLQTEIDARRAGLPPG